MVSPVHRETFTVRSYEIDASGRIPIPSLFCYLQESASNHAAEYGLSMDDLRLKDLTWMISRIHIEVKRYPVWGEKVTIETLKHGQASGKNTLTFVSFYVLMRGIMRAAEPLLHGLSWILREIVLLYLRREE